MLKNLTVSSELHTKIKANPLPGHTMGQTTEKILGLAYGDNKQKVTVKNALCSILQRNGLQLNDVSVESPDELLMKHYKTKSGGIYIIVVADFVYSVGVYNDTKDIFSPNCDVSDLGKSLITVIYTSCPLQSREIIFNECVVRFRPFVYKKSSLQKQPESLLETEIEKTQNPDDIHSLLNDAKWVRALIHFIVSAKPTIKIMFLLSSACGLLDKPLEFFTKDIYTLIISYQMDAEDE